MGEDLAALLNPVLLGPHMLKNGLAYFL